MVELLLGRTRALRRAALAAAGRWGVDALGRPTPWIFVGHAHGASARRGAAAGERGFARVVRPLPALWPELYRRHGPGRAVIPARLAAAIATRWLEEAPAGGWLAALGPPSKVGPALAGLWSRHEEAGRPDLAAGDGARGGAVIEALAGLGQRLRAVPAHAPEPDAIAWVVETLAQPPPSLARWLVGAPGVLFEELVATSGLRTRALIALARAWEALGVPVAFGLDVGRDLGGAEAALFFDAGDVHAAAHALRPLAATRHLRRALFDAFVGEGSGRILVARPGGAVELEPHRVLDGEPGTGLADLLVGLGPVPVEDAAAARALGAGRVALWRAEEPASELAAVVADIKRALRAGDLAPGECVVAVPGLAARGAAVVAALEGAGVPCALPAGLPLAAQPVGGLIRAVLGLAVGGWPARQWVAVVGSDLCAAAVRAGVDGAAVVRWVRAVGLRGGRPDRWDVEGRAAVAARNRADGAPVRHAAEALAEAIEAVDRLARPATPRAWVEAAHEALVALGVPEGVASGAASTAGLRAWGVALRALDELAAELEVVDPGPWAPEKLVQAADQALLAAAVPVGLVGGEAVRVLELAHLVGVPARAVWALGLSADAFPAPSARPFLVPGAVARRLDPREPVAHARLVLGNLLREADPQGEIERLVLCWPAAGAEGNPRAPSPVLAELLHRPTAAGPALGEWLVQPAPEPGVFDRTSALVAIARGSVGWEAALGEEDRERLAAQRAAAAGRATPAPSPYDGLVGDAIPAPARLSVSALETWLRCPARRLWEHLLGGAGGEAWDPDVDPRDRGSRVHRVLERFVRERLGQPVSRAHTLEQDAAALHAVALAELGPLGEDGSCAPALASLAREDLLAGLVDPGPAGSLRAWLEWEAFREDGGVPEAVEEKVPRFALGGLAVHGTADRVDVVAGRRVVLDYKTGAAPARAAVAQGLSVQPAVYALALGASASAFLSVKRPDEIGASGGVGDPDLLGALGTRAVELEEDLVGWLEGAIARLRRGVYHPTTAEPALAGCASCPYRRICRVDTERAAAWTGDVHRPLGASDPAGEDQP